MKNYNGWSNYATWRVNLEMFSGFDSHDEGEPYTAEFLQEIAENEMVENANGLALDYAMWFLSTVDWREIAEGLNEREE